MRGRVYAGLWWAAGDEPFLLVTVYGYTDPTLGQLQDLSTAIEAVQEYAEARGGLKTIMGG